MNDSAARHVNDEGLQAFVDGELTAPEQDYVRSHLDTCWTCRTRFEETVDTIGQFVRLREEVLEKRGIGLPEWTDIRPLLAEIPRKRSPIPRALRFRKLAMALIALTAAALAVTLIVIQPSSGDLPPAIAPIITKPKEPIPTLAPPPRTAKPRATISDASIELGILAALHGLGADLGEPVEWMRIGPGRFRVEMRGLPAEREAEIRTALEGVEGVSIRSATIARVPLTAETPLSIAETTPHRFKFEEEVLEFAGGRRRMENFTNAVLDGADAVRVRAHAWRRAQLRTSGLTGEERLLLQDIRQDYWRGMQENTTQLRALLTPLFERLGVLPERMQGGLLDTAEQADLLLNSMLAGSPSDFSDEEIVAKLQGSLEHLARLLEVE